MSRKHNAKHNRAKSRYPNRLAARGLGKSPKMDGLEQLRRTQDARVRNNGTPFPPNEAGFATKDRSAA